MSLGLFVVIFVFGSQRDGFFFVALFGDAMSARGISRPLLKCCAVCVCEQTWSSIYFHFLHLFSVSLEERKFGASIMILLWPEKIKWFCICEASIEHICNVSRLHADHFILQFCHMFGLLRCFDIIKSSSILVGCFFVSSSNRATIWLMIVSRKVRLLHNDGHSIGFLWSSII